MALGAVALIGVGLYVWWSEAPARSQAHAASGDDGSASSQASHAAGGGGSGGGGSAAAANDAGRPQGLVRRLLGDGGVGRVAVRSSADPSGPVQSAVPPDRGVPRNAGDEDHSAGWRLGQTRARIEILEGLVERYQTAYDGFVAEGNTDTATRQRVTLDRVTGRLARTRELETELRQEARGDGTLGEAQTGYEEGEPTRIRQRAAGGTVGTR